MAVAVMVLVVCQLGGLRMNLIFVVVTDDIIDAKDVVDVVNSVVIVVVHVALCNVGPLEQILEGVPECFVKDVAVIGSHESLHHAFHLLHLHVHDLLHGFERTVVEC